MDPVTIRPLQPHEAGIVRWILAEAIAWEGGPESPADESALRDPLLDRYHRDWGRDGDFGVVAEGFDVMIGAACARLHSAVDHGFGFVDADTPELGVAVDRRHRRRGVGRLLMESLADQARQLGFRQLSLSVENQNPAKILYEALGYRSVTDDGAASVMVVDV